MKPFVKWAGGKRQILSRIKEFINDSVDNNKDFTYIEPFLGGGAVFLDMMPKKAIINDLNSDLMNAYDMIKSENYVELIERLKKHADEYKKDPEGHYYDIRYWDRTDNWPNVYSDIERAARMIFLNKTCYNGLYRVNSLGQFNTPIGRYKNPTICDVETITNLHFYLSNENNQIDIMCGSYKDVMEKASDGDVIYIDPPYDYEDDDGFTKYQMSGFTFEDFKSLKKTCDEAIRRGAFVIISNNATERVIKLFNDDPIYKIVFFDVNKFKTLRSINCIGSQRKTGSEAIFWGFNSTIPLPQANDINKIIKMVIDGDDQLDDKEMVKSLIGVETTRQVAYYLSALKFFKYITHGNKLTEHAKNLRNNKDALINDIYDQLLNNKIFKKAYDQFKYAGIVTKEEIKKSILNSGLSDSTADRRAQTIKKWVEWMYKFDNRNS